jgi:HlyD family secretion protein
MTDQLSTDLASLRISRDDQREPAPRRFAWGRMVVVVVVLVGLGAGYWFGKPAIEAKIFRTEVDLTEIAVVSPAQAAVDLTSTGYVIPQTVAKVGAKVVGRISKVNIKEGQKVKAGDVLFELDPTDPKSLVTSAQAKVAAAHARALTARANHAEIDQQAKRQKKLVESGSVSSSTADDLVARAAALEAAVKAADAETAAAQAEVTALSVNLKNMIIAAPIDGTAITKPATLGDVVSPQGTLVELADFESLLIETDVPEGRMGLVKEKGPCEVILDTAPSKRYRGVVVEVSPRMNRSKATGTAKVKLLDKPERLSPEMSARVSFLTKELKESDLKEAPKKIVPQAALVDRGGSKAVFVVEGNKVKLVTVTVGAPFGTGFELTDGPAAGTRVVRDPPKSLADGQSVKERSS